MLLTSYWLPAPKAKFVREFAALLADRHVALDHRWRVEPPAIEVHAMIQR